jgi:hypothetical protein
MTGSTETGDAALRIVQVGFATTVQDRGRNGLAHLGVPVAGAVDGRTHDLVNRLVGNTPDAATIETMGSLVVEALRPVVIATSTDASRQTLSAGTKVRVDAPPGSVWAYLAVRGGVAVESVLGSRSHDTLGGVGPPALAADSVIAVRPRPAHRARCRSCPSTPTVRGARADLGRTAARLVHRRNPGAGRSPLAGHERTQPGGSATRSGRFRSNDTGSATDAERGAHHGCRPGDTGGGADRDAREPSDHGWVPRDRRGRPGRPLGPRTDASGCFGALPARLNGPERARSRIRG